MRALKFLFCPLFLMKYFALCIQKQRPRHQPAAVMDRSDPPNLPIVAPQEVQFGGGDTGAVLGLEAYKLVAVRRLYWHFGWGAVPAELGAYAASLGGSWNNRV